MFELESIDLFKKMRELPELSNSLCRSAVENIGLEPMTSCMPCKRSSQLS